MISGQLPRRYQLEWKVVPLLKHIKVWRNFWSRPPAKIKLFFLLRPCVLILKVAKNFRKFSFEALNRLRLN